MVSFDAKDKNMIFLSFRMYEEFYFEEATEKVDIEKTLFYQIFIVLHEKIHLNQSNYLYHNDDSVSNIYKKELYISNIKPRFYMKFHDNFKIEKEANAFAFDEIFNYLDKYFRDTYVNKDNLKKFIISKCGINKKDSKRFLIFYKLYIMLLSLAEKTNIKTKKLKRLEDKFNYEKKEYILGEK